MSPQYEALKEKNGPILDFSVERVAYSAPEIPQVGLEKVFEEMLPLTHVIQDLEVRRAFLMLHGEYFQKMAERIHAVTMKDDPDALVAPDMVEQFAKLATTYTDRAVSGDKRYTPYLNPQEPEEGSIGTQCIMLRMMAGIGRPLGELGPKQMMWVICTEQWQVSEDDPDEWNQIRAIEHSLDNGEKE